MSTSWRDPFGSNWFGLWLADRDDRRHGRLGRLAARRGFLKPMGEQGKVIWMIVGSDANDIRLAVELLRAIREKRLDIRLVLTFEEDMPELLAPLDECDKTGWGFAPSDRPSALKRAFQRLSPYGFIIASPHLRPHLRQMLDKQPRVIDVTQTHGLGQTAPAQAADLQTLLVQAQVDPNFRSLVNQSRQRHLWWVHDTAFQPEQWHHWLTRYPEDVLFVSGSQPESRCLPISQWNRHAIPDGEIVWLDEHKWLPAVAASVTASHFAQPARFELWQALSGNAALSLPPDADGIPPFLAHWDWRASNPQSLWEEWRLNPIRARQAGDQARRLFWQERRQAESALQSLLDQVFEW